MIQTNHNSDRRCQPTRYGARSCIVLSLCCLLSLTGCAAFRPIDAVPARYLPEEFKGKSRETERMIDLSLLRQSPVSEYLVDSGDVLSVYIEGVLGQRELPPINQSFDLTRPPTLGYPMTVRDDGTLSLPLINPIHCRGRSVVQIEDAIRYAYTVERRLLQPGRDRILVTLHQPRLHRILVVRQEQTSDMLSTENLRSGMLGSAKRGTGKIIALPAYKNDVLNALVASGGMPGLDAENVVYVIRSPRPPKPQPRPIPMAAPQQYVPQQPTIYNTQPNLGGTYSAPPQVPVGPIAQPGIGSYAPQIPPTQQPAPTGRTATSGPGGVQQMGFWTTASNPGYAIQQTAAGPCDVPPGHQPPPTCINNQPRPPGLYSGQFGGRGPRSGLGSDPSGGTTPINPYSGGPGGIVPTNYTATPGGIGSNPYAMGSGSSIDGGGMVLDPSSLGGWQPPAAWSDVNRIASGGLCGQGQGQTIRIPLRVEGCEQVTFNERDIILEDGDIVFIESRNEEVFYTGGLLGGGQFNLPRDHDLDILEAIAIAQSSGGGQNGSVGKSALNQDVTISASEVVVIRKLPNGGQIPIRVDLYKARQYPGDRIRILPEDYILLQYTKCEAIGAFVEKHILETALFGVAASSLQSNRR